MPHYDGPTAPCKRQPPRDGCFAAQAAAFCRQHKGDSMIQTRLIMAIAITATASLLLQVYVDYLEDGPTANLPDVLWNMARYYTILTNTVVAVVFARAALGGARPSARASAALTLLWWLVYAPKGGLGLRAPLYWVVWPLLYSGYALLRGTFDGVYPYYFLDLPKLGMAGLLQETGIVALGFLVFGYLLAGVARVLR